MPHSPSIHDRFKERSRSWNMLSLFDHAHGRLALFQFFFSSDTKKLMAMRQFCLARSIDRYDRRQTSTNRKTGKDKSYENEVTRSEPKQNLLPTMFSPTLRNGTSAQAHKRPPQLIWGHAHISHGHAHTQDLLQLELHLSWAPELPSLHSLQKTLGCLLFFVVFHFECFQTAPWPFSLLRNADAPGFSPL